MRAWRAIRANIWAAGLLMAASAVGRSAPAEVGDRPRPYLGVAKVDLTADSAERLGLTAAEGVLIGKVYVDSPAERAGLLPGDVILAFDDRPTPRFASLQTLYLEAEIGSRHELRVWRQRQTTVLRLLVQAAPPGKPAPRRPGPSDDERWYLHATGDYWLRVPPNWRTIGKHRRQTPDPHYDSLVSPDERYAIYCHRGSWPADDPPRTLEAYVRKWLAQTPTAHPWTAHVAGEPAVRLAYPEGRNAVFRIGFCHAGRHYVINAVGPREEGTEQLPPPIAGAIDSLQFLRAPAVPAPPPTDVAEVRPTPPSPAPPSIAPPSIVPPPTAPPHPLPPGWGEHRVGDVVVRVPADWKTSEFAGDDEALWYLGSPLLPDLSFALMRDTSLAELLGDDPVQKRWSLKVGGVDAQAALTTQARPAGRRWIVHLQSGGPLSFVAYATDEQWARAEPLFQRVLEQIRIEAASAAVQGADQGADDGAVE